MTLATILSITFTAAKVAQQMVADGRTTTTAEEDAALDAARQRADDADAKYDEADKQGR